MKRIAMLWVALAGHGCADLISLEEATVDPNLVEDEDGPAYQPTLCQIYCGTVMANCTGSFAVYGTPDTCMEVCAQLPEGTPEDEIGNSVQCRLRNAKSAPTEPSFYCPIAGPGGNGVCGSNCEALCTVAEHVCQNQWTSVAACREQCAIVPDLGTYSTSPDKNMYQGDSVQCRLFHLSSAAVADADVHCAHAAGAPPCDD